jgi:hypothetical protein
VPRLAAAAWSGRLFAVVGAVAAGGCLYDFDPPAGFCSPESGCPEGEYCAYADLLCGEMALGRCTPKPQPPCVPPPWPSTPVCACDGQIYDDPCGALSVGVDLASSRCTMPAGKFACGYRLCDSATQFCVVLNRASAAQPELECSQGCSPPSCPCAMGMPRPGVCTCSEQNGTVTEQCTL